MQALQALRGLWGVPARQRNIVGELQDALHAVTRDGLVMLRSAEADFLRHIFRELNFDVDRASNDAYSQVRPRLIVLIQPALRQCKLWPPLC